MFLWIQPDRLDNYFRLERENRGKINAADWINGEICVRMTVDCVVRREPRKVKVKILFDRNGSEDLFWYEIRLKMQVLVII